jgi:hypothetical protein
MHRIQFASRLIDLTLFPAMMGVNSVISNLFCILSESKGKGLVLNFDF